MCDLLDHFVGKNPNFVAKEVSEQPENERKFTQKQDLRYLSPPAATEESFCDALEKEEDLNAKIIL